MASRDRPLPEIFPPPADAPEFDEAGAPVEAAPARRPWQVESDGAAEWAMSKYAAALATVVQLKQQRDDYHALVDRWFVEASTPPARTADYFGELLSEYAIKRRAASPKDKRGEDTAKTLQLVTGRVTTTKSPPAVVVKLDGAVVDWAESVRIPVDQTGYELGGWQDCETVELDGVTHWLVPLSDIVVKVEKSIRLRELRQFVKVEQRDVDCECVARGPVYSNSSDPNHDGSPDRCELCDDTGKVPVLLPIGPSGEVVPGCEVSTETVTAKVTPTV